MASIPIHNAPSDLTMIDFRAINDMFGSLSKSHRFIARVRPTGQYLFPFLGFMRDLTYLCEVGELPGRGIATADVRYYGPHQKLPYQTTYEDISLNFICRTASLERQFFDDWMGIINPVNTWDFNYRDDYSAMIDVFQYSEYSADGGFSPTAEYLITMHNAYPILVNPQPMTWSDDIFQRLVVTFTYTHWTRPGLDPEPSWGGPGGYSFELVENRVVRR
jgi:hypothetical protein